MSDISSVKISVVVPAYNAVNFLHDCVGSVLAQRPAQSQANRPADNEDTHPSGSVPSFEVIIIDDGSTDSTAEIATTLAEDPRVRLLQQENAGVSAARNAGIRAARGEFISFLDADDMLHPEAFSRMWRYVRRFGDDTIVVPGECYSGLAKNWTLSEAMKEDYNSGYKLMSGLEAVEECLYRRELEPDMHGALIPRRLFNENTLFRPGRYEDLDLFYRLYEKAPRVVLIKAPLYFYRDHEGSFVNNFSLERLHVMDVTRRILEHYKDTPLEAAAIDRMISACFNMIGLISQNIGRQPADIQSCMKIAERDILEILHGNRFRVLMNKKGRGINKPMILISYLGSGALKAALGLRKFH